MRTLKKSLCLVLVVVMMFSLCVFGVSADTDFDDYSEIEYTQAVDLLTTLGVITGYEDGTFGPDGTLTRAEACAIIARLLKNDDLTGTSDFTDVSSDHWAVNYIAYCASEGIVAGYGDGTFGPDDTLTGYAWMKMLLCAAGYDASEEGMVGTTWEIGVATLAKDQDVTDDVSGVNYGDDVSRDLACKLAYNMALKTIKVKWKTTNGGLTVTGDGYTITQGDSGEYSYYNEDGNAWESGETKATFFQYVWEAEVKDTTDDFGRPAKKYTSIADIDVDITIAEDPEVSVSARTSASSFASLLSGYKFTINYADGSASKDRSINNSSSSTYAEGDEIAATLTVNGAEADNLALVDDQTLCERLENLSANGKVIEFYDTDDDDVLDAIVTIEYSVGELTTLSTSGTVTKYKVEGSGSYEADSDDPDDSKAYVIGGSVSKNDIVTYVEAEGNDDGETRIYIYPTTSVEGYFSTYSTGKFASVTVDGTRYTVGSGVYNYDNKAVLGSDSTSASNSYAVKSSTIDDIFGDTDEEITIYVDQFGYAVDANPDTSSTSSATNYVYVTDVSKDDVDEGDTIWKVKYVTTEGSTGTAYVQGDGETQEIFEYFWYKKSSSADSSGYYDFKSVDDGTTYSSAYGLLNNGTLKSSQSTIVNNVKDCVGDNYSTVKANSSTTFIIRTKTSSGNVSYKVYSGLSKVPTYDGTLSGVYAYALIKNSTDYAVAVYINVGDVSTSGDDDDEVIFLLTTSGTEGSGYDSSVGETYYTYNAIVDGEKTTIKGDDEYLALGNRGLVYYSIDSSSGWYTNFDEVSYENVDDSYTKYSQYTFTYDANAMDDENDITFDGGVLSWGDVSISLTDDAVVYYIYGGGNTTTVGDGDLLDGTLRANATIWTVNKSNSNQTAVEVYFWSSKSLA